MSIQYIIEKATAAIPTTWPLQSFIAMNPLWDQIDKPMAEVIRQLAKFIPITGTLSLHHYHELWRNHQITLPHIKNAVLLWLEQNKLTEMIDLDGRSINMINALCDFLIKTEIHTELEVCDENSNKSKNLMQDRGCPLTVDEIQATRESILKWCAAFFDLGQAAWPMAAESTHFFAAWREMVVLQSPRWKKIIAKIPTDSIAAAEFLIEKRGIPKIELEHYLTQILFQVKGWSSVIKWLQNKPNNNYTQKSACMSDIISIWLAHEEYYNDKNAYKNRKEAVIPQSSEKISAENFKIIWSNWLGTSRAITEKQFTNPVIQTFNNKLDIFSLSWIWQTAWEYSYRDNLLLSIKKQLSKKKNASNNQPLAQVIFCIDTRSEGLRRHLENVGPYETFGFAGFFAFPFQLRDKTKDLQVAQSPPLLDPDTVLEYGEKHTYAISKNVALFFQTMSHVKRKGLAAYALFELIGSWLSIKLIGKTLFPRLYHYFTRKKNQCCPALNPFTENGFTVEEATSFAAALLKTLGLTEHFAKIVLICAHRALTDNNPFQASFDCGACGGNGGTPNAIVACAALNHPAVREALKKYDIRIPAETLFIPGCHNTTVDTVDIFVNETERNKCKTTLLRLEADFKVACDHLRKERMQSLPGRNHVKTRATSWSELIPEMGLANNAAFVIGPRFLTRELNLRRRVFLHTYIPEFDTDGSILETILTAPVVIAHWINSQYYFSTTDSKMYGSGNKAIHNVVSQLGVMEGNHSDLKIGLPIQNVYFHGKLQHQPLKLLVVLYAKRKFVDLILAKHQTLQNLFNGQWCYLQVIDPEEQDV